MRITLLCACGLAASLLAPATAPAATAVSVGKTCYAEGDRIAIDGTGFSPGGQVNLSLEKAGEVLERTEDPRAEDDGTIGGTYGVDNETGWFDATQTRFDMTLRLVDQTRLGAGQPAESPDVTATTSFIFSRWNIGIAAVGGKIHPRRSVTIRAVGYTNAIGKPLYAHWMRGTRRVHTRRLGKLAGPCGDRRVRLRRGFPFRPVLRGRYRVTFNSSRTDPRAQDSIVHQAARVRRTIRR